MMTKIVTILGTSVDGTLAAHLPTFGGARLRAFRVAGDALGARGYGFGTAGVDPSPTPAPVLDMTSDPTS